MEAQMNSKLAVEPTISQAEKDREITEAFNAINKIMEGLDPLQKVKISRALVALHS